MTDSQSLPTSPSQQMRPQRSQLVGTVVSLIGWVVVIVPIILMSAVIFAHIMNPENGITAPKNVALIFLGAILLFCMIAAPHLLGQAVRFRERAMWRAALITALPTVCVIVYFVFRWLSNLA